jgi:hypothetical protein
LTPAAEAGMVWRSIDGSVAQSVEQRPFKP